VSGVENYEIIVTDEGFRIVVDEIRYGDLVTINYDATMKNKKLAGTTISNIATAICDNIKDAEPVSSTSKSEVNKNNLNAPQTGDNSNLLLYIVGVVVSAVALIALFLVKRKNGVSKIE
jgi:LPXTG-motif cell wall-anchored protein